MKADHPDRRFEQEVLAEPGGESLYRCYSCGTCASACLVRRVNPDFNPRLPEHCHPRGVRAAWPHGHSGRGALFRVWHVRDGVPL